MGLLSHSGLAERRTSVDASFDGEKNENADGKSDVDADSFAVVLLPSRFSEYRPKN